MLVTDSFSGDLVALVVTLLVILVVYFKWSYQYWKRRNVPYLEPQIPFGNMSASLRGKEHPGISTKRFYDEMKSNGWKYGGYYVFTRPLFLAVDLDLVKNVIIKDFQYFMDRDFYVNDKEPLQQHLLNLRGAKWRNLRAKLSPTFTSGKMKMMFGAMAECHADLLKRMNHEVATKEPINIKEILACFTTNIIGSCAFGLEIKALEDDKNPFREVGRKMFNPTKWAMFKRTFAMTFPRLSEFLNISINSRKRADFFTNIVKRTMDFREKNNYTRNDFMQLLINLTKNIPSDPTDHDGKPLSLDEVTSQASSFFGAGFETSSTLMTFTLYELSKNQDIQDRLRREINETLAKHNSEVTYDSVQDIKYLTQVLDETLRMHPPGPYLRRKCVKDYKIPGEDVVIEEDTIVVVSLLGIHYDKDYYPNPTKFDPERFNEENRKTRHYCTHMPFGDGPRNCIGMRFGLLQSKVGLVYLLKNYKFTLNKKTHDPMIYKAASFVLTPEGDVWLHAEKI